MMNAVDDQGSTALHYAAQGGFYKVGRNDSIETMFSNYNHAVKNYLIQLQN